MRRDDLPYVEHVDVRGGGLRRWLAFVLLRASAKRLRIAGRDVQAIRAEQAALDLRLGRDVTGLRTIPAPEAEGYWLEGAAPDPQRVILFLHGGAFMFRYPKMHAAMVAPWCEALHARALAVDYRLAPEHPFPAAIDDCQAAYRWLLGQGYSGRDIVLAGDSAGGNLALALLHAIKAAGEPMPACAVLLSPVVDLTLSGASFVTHARRDPVFSLGTLLALRSLYIEPEEMLDVRASPLFGDFRGLPPLLIQVGSEEVLLDDSLRAAARAHAAGVDVTLEIWERMPHVFQAMPVLPQSAAAAERILRFAARHTGWG